MHAKIPIRKRIANRKALALENQEFHSLAADAFEESSVSSIRRVLLERRSAHLNKLTTLPLFGRLLERKTMVEVESEGVKKRFLVFKNGLKVGPKGFSMVLVLDPKLRGILMAKIQAKEKLKWVPIRIVAPVKPAVGPSIWKYVPYQLTGSAEETYNALSIELSKRENEFDFSKKCSEASIRNLKQYI